MKGDHGLGKITIRPIVQPVVQQKIVQKFSDSKPVCFRAGKCPLFDLSNATFQFVDGEGIACRAGWFSDSLPVAVVFDPPLWKFYHSAVGSWFLPPVNASKAS
jgi:hypothetical protein